MSEVSKWKVERDDGGECYFVGAAEALERIGRQYDDRLSQITAAILAFCRSPQGNAYFEGGAALLDRKTERIVARGKEKRSRERWRRPIQFVLVGLATLIFRWAMSAVVFLGKRASARAEALGEASNGRQFTSQEDALKPRMSPAGLRFWIGRRAAVTANQGALYEWLRMNQDEVAKEVLLRLRLLYARLRDDLAAQRANEPWLSIVLPPLNEPNAINDTFKLTEVELHCTKWRIGLRFAAMWEDEHELEILIDDTVVREADYRDERNFI